MIRALDNNNDWTLGNHFLTDKAEILQDCETRLREWRNDCFFNPGAGVDYNACFEANDNNSLALQQISVCKRTPGVINVADYRQELGEDRKLKSHIVISTIYGEGEVNYA